MNRWLLKTEPGEYSWDDLARDGGAVWDGITNPLALRNLRQAAPGDPAFIYHTGKERRIVGVARITSAAYPDPRLKGAARHVVDIVPVGPLAEPVGLERIKEDPAFRGWDLLRIPRLSFVPVPDPLWARILKMSGTRG